MTNASELYEAGKLDDAIAAQTEAVKKDPANTDLRGFLCELLCFAGEFERADRMLDTISKQAPEREMGTALLRQLVRAEIWRQQFFSDGRVPELLTDPTPSVEAQLRASVHVRAGEHAEAAKALADAEEKRVPVKGTFNGESFDDMRDLDDQMGGVLEVLSTTGKYFWVPLESVETMELRPPARPQDLVWRRTAMEVRGGPDGEVYLPAIYAPMAEEAADAVRLARATDWLGGDEAAMRGQGLRTFLVGEEARTLMEFERVEFTAE